MVQCDLSIINVDITMLMLLLSQASLTGPGSLPQTTVINVFKRTIHAYPHQTAFNVKRDGVWKGWTYLEYYKAVCCVAKSLFKLGLEPRHGVSILGFNSPEWFISYMAAIMVSGWSW